MNEIFLEKILYNKKKQMIKIILNKKISYINY